MAGSPKSVNTDTPIDPKYLQYVNSLSSGGNTTNITSSKDSIKQYVKTKNGIFNGAFGSVAQILNISSGVLDLTANSTGAVVVRRVVYVLTESGSTDTLTAIDVNDLELPNQELTLMTSTSTTITITHDATAPGTQRPIHCPGDTDYILSSQEAVTLIFDAIHKIWIITSKGVTSVGTGAITATQLASNAVTTVKILDTNVTFAKIQNLNTMKVIGRTASGAGVSSEISILDEDTMSSNSAIALATQQSIKAYVLANSGVGLSDNNIWTGTAIFDTTASGSTTSSPIKFQGDGNNTAQRVMEIGEYGAHGVKFIAEILGDTGRTMTNPDGGSDINVPGSNEPALSIKSAMIMNTYTMYDLDSLVFSQGASSTTPPLKMIGCT